VCEGMASIYQPLIVTVKGLKLSFEPPLTKDVFSLEYYECLDWQPSQFVNIVGKDDFIQQCSKLAGLERLRVMYHQRALFGTTSKMKSHPPTHGK
jgi:hypothetical protein